MWSRERGAGRHAPQLLSGRQCTLPHPPPLHCRLGQVCVRGLVSAVSRAHLHPPCSRSLRLDLAPRFCGVGWWWWWEGSEHGEAADWADEARCKVGELQVTAPGPGLRVPARASLGSPAQGHFTSSDGGGGSSEHSRPLSWTRGSLWPQAHRRYWMHLRLPPGRGEFQAA